MAGLCVQGAYSWENRQVWTIGDHSREEVLVLRILVLAVQRKSEGVFPDWENQAHFDRKPKLRIESLGMNDVFIGSRGN